MPINLFLDTPVTFVDAWFTSVIFPSGEIVTSGSSDASIRLRAYREACFNAVTSHAAEKESETSR